MPALVDIRRRIRSVKNTQQITKAMKMVSAAKLRRAQDAMFAARPYARKMMEVLNSLATRAQPDAHPLLQVHDDEKVLLVVITADKGLCGGFNANIIRAAARFLEEQQHAEPPRERRLELDLVGRKGRDFFRRRRYRVRSEHIGLFQSLQFPAAQRIAQSLIKSYVEREVDRIHIVYNEFKTVIAQKVVVEQLLPIRKLEFDPREAPLDYLYEPSPGAIFDEILPKHVEIQVWRALLESAAAEHGARMAAMDAATNNAGEMIDRLTLYMNKVRQAAITKEIIEVVSGASA
ncbi:MAG TPA: ATP synthase F1 subunit gamma [Vicinamibacteria bacterium]|jgi:F-type H+-transporting ATPase subunit gamma|nr:ATP synthase F1 subunit gamma [Vicinamibacteria bacterium]